MEVVAVAVNIIVISLYTYIIILCSAKPHRTRTLVLLWSWRAFNAPRARCCTPRKRLISSVDDMRALNCRCVRWRVCTVYRDRGYAVHSPSCISLIIFELCRDFRRRSAAGTVRRPGRPFHSIPVGVGDRSPDAFNWVKLYAPILARSGFHGRCRKIRHTDVGQN